MPRPKGSKNKKTIEREQEQMGLPPQSRSISDDDSTLPPLLDEPVPAPIQVEVDFIEYNSPSGDRWRVERGQDLCALFDLKPTDLTRWHTALAPEERAWRLLRLHFGISPLAGEKNLEFLRPQSLEEIAKGMGLTIGDLEGEIEAARAFWARWVVSQTAQTPYVAPSLMRQTEDEKEALLRRYNLDDLTRPGDKLYAIVRVGDLQGQLDDDQGRPIAIQAIRMEIQMAMFDRLITKAGQRVESNLGGRDELQSLLRSQKDIRENYLKVMEALEATQAQSSSLQKRVQFVDALGILTKAVQDYESNGDNTLIDGLNTAAEIKLLTTPLSVRPPQYRPDLVALLHDALKSHNLWDANYEPPQFDRGTYRRLMKAFQEALQSSAEADGAVVNFPDSENEDSSEEGEEDSGGAPVPTTPVAPPPPVVTPHVAKSAGYNEIYT